jgi:surface antigen
MKGRMVLIAALTAPTLAGCGGFGFGDGATPVAAGAPPPAAAASPTTVRSLPPPSPAGAPQQAPSAASPPPAPPAIPTGAALGGVLGGPVGAALAEADRQAAWNAQIAALDSGQRRSWRGAHGVFGFVEPGAEAVAGCRSYSQTIYVSGRPNHGQGVACKQPDGGWRMTS